MNDCIGILYSGSEFMDLSGFLILAPLYELVLSNRIAIEPGHCSLIDAFGAVAFDASRASVCAAARAPPAVVVRRRDRLQLRSRCVDTDARSGAALLGLLLPRSATHAMGPCRMLASLILLLADSLAVAAAAAAAAAAGGGAAAGAAAAGEFASHAEPRWSLAFQPSEHIA